MKTKILLVNKFVEKILIDLMGSKLNNNKTTYMGYCRLLFLIEMWDFIIFKVIV